MGQFTSLQVEGWNFIHRLHGLNRESLKESASFDSSPYSRLKILANMGEALMPRI